MPRTKLDPDHWVNYGRFVISEQITQQALGKCLGISQQAVSQKLRTMNFTLPEFRKIVKELGMDDETILKMLGGNR